MRNKKQDTVFHVDATDELLTFLMRKMDGKSRTAVKSLLGHRQVTVNGSVQTRHDTPLKAGDKVCISAGKGNVELRHPKLKLVYEDEYLIIVEKKQGLLTVAAHPGSQEMTVMSVLKAYVRKQNQRNNIYVVHRLDRETSGLLVFAKSVQLQEYMRSYWKELVKERTYIALAEGVLDKQEGTITTWLTEDKRNAVVYSSPVDDGGAKAVTHYKVLKERRDGDQPSMSLVELHLETGRTNQIRVHLASIGHPVVGDRKYGHGNDFSPADRLCLHARVLEFIHPATERIIRFETPIPKEFRL